MAKPKGRVGIKADKCKGCGLCIAACPTKSLETGTAFNRLGYHPAVFREGTGCTGCGICFYACPEPDAVTVTRLRAESAA